MVWRASISSHVVYYGYELDPMVEETLRTTLLSFKAQNRKDVIAKISAGNVQILPYLAITSRNFKNGTANSIAAISAEPPASLHVDQFGLILFPDETSFPHDIFKQISNIQPDDHRFAIFSENARNNVMAKRLAQEYVRSNNKKIL